MPLLSDQPASQDKLHFTRFVRALSTLLLEAGPDSAPLTVGLYGSWGSGKSTLLKLLKTEMSKQAALRDLCLPVEFSPWEYRNEENLLVPLLLTLQKTAGGRGWAEIGKIAAIASGVAAKQLLYAGVRFVTNKALDPEKLEKQAKEAAKEVEGRRVKLELSDLVKLQELVGGFVEKIRRKQAKTTAGGKEQLPLLVFMIDDLDRCHPAERIVDLLEQIRLFLDVPGCVFVLACDRKVVVQAINKRFEHQGEAYLEKFIQAPFCIPPAHPADLSQLLADQPAPGGVDKDEWVAWWERLSPLLGNNPRRLKRLYNQWTGAWEVIKDDPRASAYLLAKWLWLSEASEKLAKEPALALRLEAGLALGKFSGESLATEFGLQASAEPFLRADAHRMFGSTEMLALHRQITPAELRLTRHEVEQRVARAESLRDLLEVWENIDLSYGHLPKADFSGCKLRAVSFKGAHLEEAVFDGATFDQVAMEGAEFTKLSLKDVSGLGTVTPATMVERLFELKKRADANAK